MISNLAIYKFGHFEISKQKIEEVFKNWQNRQNPDLYEEQTWPEQLDGEWYRIEKTTFVRMQKRLWLFVRGAWVIVLRKYNCWHRCWNSWFPRVSQQMGTRICERLLSRGADIQRMHPIYEKRASLQCTRCCGEGDEKFYVITPALQLTQKISLSATD